MEKEVAEVEMEELAEAEAKVEASERAVEEILLGVGCSHT